MDYTRELLSRFNTIFLKDGLKRKASTIINLSTPLETYNKNKTLANFFKDERVQ